MSDKKKLPIGEISYALASSMYYVDKTLFIRDYIDKRDKVTLITRPRRFGKTLTMNMVRTFFEKTEEDTSVYFKDKKIWSCGEKYIKEQGSCPVIWLTFKDVKYSTWDKSLTEIGYQIAKEFKRHKELETSTALNSQDKQTYSMFVNEEAPENKIIHSVEILSKMLHDHWKKAPLVIIDEYDTPISFAYSKGFYDEAIEFMRNFFSSALKDNEDLGYGLLTGILRVSKESLFSGLNNFIPNSILSTDYDLYFGFTPDEVKEMLSYYGLESKLTEACEWYDGYKFGDTKIFNPWSVLNYVKYEGKPGIYWGNTSDNAVVGEMLKTSDYQTREKIRGLLEGRPVAARINENLTYPELRSKRDNIFNLLFLSGYLKAADGIAYMSTGTDPATVYELEIPNKEVRCIYEDEIIGLFEDADASLHDIWGAIVAEDEKTVQDKTSSFLSNSGSYQNSGELLFQGFVLGLIAFKNREYFISRERESGLGRYDLEMEPRDMSKPGIVFEVEYASPDQMSKDAGILSKLAVSAVKQIDDRHYCSNLKLHGVKKILKIGMAFSDKQASVRIMPEV
ncbi:MAG: ATP-binding protein [Clostridia bacterium]|nr:ATP-binding protein [Clostridia bacterium]